MTAEAELRGASGWKFAAGRGPQPACTVRRLVGGRHYFRDMMPIRIALSSTRSPSASGYCAERERSALRQYNIPKPPIKVSVRPRLRPARLAEAVCSMSLSVLTQVAVLAYNTDYWLTWGGAWRVDDIG